MALHPNFPESPYAILDPAIRWFPADEALRETSMEKLMPPLVPEFLWLLPKHFLIPEKTLAAVILLYAERLLAS